MNLSSLVTCVLYRVSCTVPLLEPRMCRHRTPPVLLAREKERKKKKTFHWCKAAKRANDSFTMAMALPRHICSYLSEAPKTAHPFYETGLSVLYRPSSTSGVLWKFVRFIFIQFFITSHFVRPVEQSSHTHTRTCVCAHREHSIFG